VVEVLVDLLPVEKAQRNRPTGGQFSLSMLEKAGGISHAPPP
jgi:hypothetical protein